MCEIITVNFLATFDTFAYDEHDVDHEVRPRGETVVAVNEDILQGLELPLCSLLHPECYFVVDVVIEVIVGTNSFVDLIAEEDCGF